ncbi:MAG: citrate/2-methylcitrate synthase [Gemmatimonadota bacterium]
MFACARVSGRTAHILEQLDHNRLIRPKAEYVGPARRSVNPSNNADEHGRLQAHAGA